MFVKKCGAKARTNFYQPCRQPAMINGRCRLHGGKSSGPNTKEGLKRLKVARTKHGFYSEKEILERKKVGNLIKKITSLARISHTFSRQIAALMLEIGRQVSEGSVELTRPHYPGGQDRASECPSCPKKCEKCGLEAC